MPQHNMPDDWEPPYPAWSANFGDNPSLAIAYYGVQSRDGNIAEFDTAFSLGLNGPDAPDHVDRGRFTDLAGSINHIFVCYWRDVDSHARFAEQSTFARWLASDSRLTGDQGVWVEAFLIPMAHFATLYASERAAGSAHLTGKPMSGPIAEHAYPGSLRDRIPASETDQLSSPLTATPSTDDRTETRGRRIILVAPEELCLTLDAQDLLSCGDEERELYLTGVRTNLEEGVKYLMDNPFMTGCLTCRLVDQLDENGDTEDRSFAMSYFLDLAHLEAYAHHHPTHVAMTEGLFDMAGRLENPLEGRFWSEVAVLAVDGTRLEYINCHAQTGLLPFLERSN